MSSGINDGKKNPGCFRCIRPLAGRDGIATFSPDGRWLAVAAMVPGRPGDVTLWDVRVTPAKPAQALKGAAGDPTCMVFSPDSGRVAYTAAPHLPPRGAGPGQVKIWEAETGKALLSLDDLPYGPAGAVAFSPDGKRLALAADDRAVHLLDAATGKELAAFRGDVASPVALAFSPDGKLLASSGEDGIVWLWDLASRKHLRSLVGDSAVGRDGLQPRRPPPHDLESPESGGRLGPADGTGSPDPQVQQHAGRLGAESRRRATGLQHVGRGRDDLGSGHGSAAPDAARPRYQDHGSRLQPGRHGPGQCCRRIGTVKLWDPATGQLRGNSEA